MLTDDQINKIADHVFSNPTRPHRFNSEKYGPNMNINSASDLKQAIQKAADDPKSKVIERADGGYLIRQPSTNLSVLADGNGDGKRSVRDSSYEPFDKKWSNEAERAKARESKCKDPQEKKDAALERQFNTTAGHGKSHSV